VPCEKNVRGVANKMDLRGRDQAYPRQRAWQNPA
jgi:hypothetical protein